MNHRATIQEALQHQREGRIAEAERAYARVLQQDPDNPDALHLMGTVYLARGQTDAAVQFIGRAAALLPRYALAHTNLGVALKAGGSLEPALASFRHALNLNPRDANSWMHLGETLEMLGRPGDALHSYDQALALKPGDSALLARRVAIVMKWGNAAASTSQQSFTTPEEVDFERMHPLEAIARCDQVLAQRPDDRKARAVRGLALLKLGRLDEVVVALTEAIAGDPNDAALYYARGVAYERSGKLEAANREYTRALELNPKLPFAVSSLLMGRLHGCDWTHREEDLRLARTAADNPAFLPTPVLSMLDDPALHLVVAKNYTRRWPRDLIRRIALRPRAERIHLGFLSADFRDHVVAHAIVELLERHDRNAFRVTGLATASDVSDVRRRVAAATDRWVDLSGIGDQEAAHAIREHHVDILVDLGGYTTGARPGILNYRPAPVQVGYLGYPATMGTEAVDYIIGDHFVMPPGSEAYYSEQLVRLPECFMPYDTTRAQGANPQTRQEQGLPEGVFVFCSFNAAWKLHPGIFDVWMRLLKQVEGSVLWLRGGEADAEANLRREVSARGLDAERLVFTRYAKSPGDHLARHDVADLFLDTLPYNAHQTACDALFAGLPVLTCAGRSFASRVAGSLLYAAGVPELVTENLEDYERLALELVRDMNRLRDLRARIRAARATALFDMNRLCRHLEAAYRTMLSRFESGRAPVHFAVDPILTEAAK